MAVPHVAFDWSASTQVTSALLDAIEIDLHDTGVVATNAVSKDNLVLAATRPTSPPVGTVFIQTGLDVTPPTAPTLAVPSATSTTVSLSWSGATDNVSVQDYDVYRNGTKINGAPIGTTTYTDTGLSPNTAYGPYLIRARDAAGNISGDSNTRSVSTSSSGDVTAPTVPAGVAAAVGDTQTVVTWSPSTDATGVTDYRLYVNGSLNTTSTSSPKTITGLTNGTTYSITVTARDAAGNESAQSSAASVTPAAATDTTAPTVPVVAPLTPGNGQISGTWTASTDAVGVTGYKIYVNGSYYATVSGSTTSYLATGLTNGTAYTVRISAVDAAGNESAQSTAQTVTPVGSSGFTWTDTFTRADATASSVGSTAVGNGWQLQAGAGAWGIVSNQLKATGNSTGGMLVQADTAKAFTTDNQYVQIKYSGTAPSNGRFYMCLRVDTGVTQFLAAQVIPVPTSGTSQVIFSRMVSGSLTTVGSAVTLPGGNLVAGDLLRFEVNGTAMTFKVNGSTVTTNTSATVTTGPAAALRTGGTTGTGLLAAVFDDYEAGDL